MVTERGDAGATYLLTGPERLVRAAAPRKPGGIPRTLRIIEPDD